MSEELFAVLQAYGAKQKSERLEAERQSLYDTAVRAYAPHTRYPELFKKELKEFINSLSDEIIDEGVNLYEGTPAGTALHKVINGVGYNFYLEESNEISKRKYTLKVLIISLERRLRGFVERVVRYEGELTQSAIEKMLEGIEERAEKEFIVCEYDEFVENLGEEKEKLFSLDGKISEDNIAMAFARDEKVYLFISGMKPIRRVFKARKE